MGFGDNIKKRNNEILKSVNKEVLDVFETFGTLVVFDSPTAPDAAFSKGLFKNSWYVAVNEFDPTVGTTPDSQGMGSLSRIASVKYSDAFLGKDGFISLSNNLSYSYRVEYLGWPAGEGTNGWHWTGTVGAYAPVRNSIISLKGALKK